MRKTIGRILVRLKKRPRVAVGLGVIAALLLWFVGRPVIFLVYIAMNDRDTRPATAAGWWTTPAG